MLKALERRNFGRLDPTMILDIFVNNIPLQSARFANKLNCTDSKVATKIACV